MCCTTPVDSIIFAPSMFLAEGKSVGTAKPSDLVLLRDLLSAKDYHYRQYAEARRVGQTVGRRKLQEVQDRVREKGGRLISLYLRGKLDEREFRRQMVGVMKPAWRDVFLAGLRAGGTPGQGAGAGKTLVALDIADDTWLRGAMQHEMQYLNGFMDTVVEGGGTMPYDRRLGMYADSLLSFYESARVISLPVNTVLHWIGSRDARTCPGCGYLMDNSPYTKLGLPTVPGAGLVSCLTNCRCRLLARRVTPEESRRIEEAAKFTRGTHIKHLRRLKAVGHL
jgi:hypothetical protein